MNQASLPDMVLDRMMKWLWVAALLGACVESNATRCGDGRVCPEGLVCAAVTQPTEELCVSPEQVTACEGLTASSPCGADGLGRCYDGVCLPGGCGNGRLDAELEECDDRNTVPADGCSPLCLVERCGNGALDMPLGEQCDDGTTGISGDGCSSTCRVEAPAWTLASPTPIPAMQGTELAYMARDGVVIAFGGQNEGGYLGETWAWTPGLRQWTRLAPRRSPSARRAPSMAYDSVNEYVLLFGGEGLFGDLGDTWKWDGTTWTELHPPASPPPRRNTQMAFDPVRQRFVLAGGRAGATSMRDTWEFDGTTWIEVPAVSPDMATLAMAYHAASQQMIAAGAASTAVPMQTWTWDGTTWLQLAPANVPSVEEGFRLAYDEGRQLVVLFGGNNDLSNAVWEWDGNNWSGPLVPASPPPARYLHGSAYDGTQVVVFGGAENVNGPYRGDTWTWTGSWSSVSAGVVVPSARSKHAMAYDPLRGVAVVHGGFSGPTLADTWMWNGRAWQVSIASAPVRKDAAMAFDATRGRMVLFGGTDNGNVSMTSLAELDMTNPTSWTSIAASGPSAREGHAMAFDAARNETVLFGGAQGITRYGDTWTWDGTTWTERTVPGPSARTDAKMAWDPRRQRIVLFGGFDGAIQSDTWEWDGAAWTQRTTPTQPRPRQRHSLAYDPIRARLILHGGQGVFQLGDLWELDDTDWRPLTVDDTLVVADEVMYYDPLARGMITFGGTASSVLQNDLRLLRFSSGEPVDLCIAGDDADGDELTACDDPDCWAYCTPLCPPAASCPSAVPRCGDGTCDPIEDHLVCIQDCPMP